MTLESLAPGPKLYDCLIQHLQEQVGRLRAELSDVARDFLSMQEEDQSLLEQESDLDKAFSILSLRIRRLLSDRVGHPQTCGLQVESNCQSSMSAPWTAVY